MPRCSILRSGNSTATNTQLFNLAVASCRWATRELRQMGLVQFAEERPSKPRAGLIACDVAPQSK